MQNQQKLLMQVVASADYDRRTFYLDAPMSLEPQTVTGIYVLPGHPNVLTFTPPPGCISQQGDGEVQIALPFTAIRVSYSAVR